MKFSYTALTADNQKINDVIEAESKEMAQEALHQMGVAILSVIEISEDEFERIKKEEALAKSKRGIQTFNFTATDPQQKTIHGTIDADSDFSAYKRLRLEYHFNVTELYASSGGEAERLQSQNMIGQWEAKLGQNQTINKSIQSAEEKENAEKEKINQQLTKEVDRVIDNVKKALLDYRHLFSPELYNQIQVKLNELERIRTSNNVKHVTDLSEELYELIKRPDLESPSDQKDNYQFFVKQIEEDRPNEGQGELYQKAVEMIGLKSIFGKIKHQLGSMPDPANSQSSSGLINRFKSLFSFLKPKSKTDSFVHTNINEPESKPTADPVNESTHEAIAEKKEEEPSSLTFLFIEIDSFIAWLLSFYIIYFFLVNFSIEKNIGLNQEFVLKTLKNPLILNISVLLLLSHFILRIRNLYLKTHTVTNVFLFLFSISFYLLLIMNY